MITNKRRSAPHESVSLRRQPPHHANPAPKAPAFISKKSSEESNAESWFENSNNAPAANTSSYLDGLLAQMPPLRHAPLTRSPADSPPYHIGQPQDSSRQSPTDSSRPSYGHAMLHHQPSTSSSGEYRSVIDDLTIQNQKLKQKLRKYEHAYAPTLSSDKLFELRTFGLPAKRKRKLEETLRDFVVGLYDSSDSKASSPPSEPAVPVQQLKPSSSHTSTRVADSGYGSLTVSNQASSSTPHPANARRNMTGREVKARDRSIHSYLHDIPESLMANTPAFVSDRSKMKIVVRRLEQLFAGIGASSEGHHQPMQQQEVAQSAALADRSAMEARGQTAMAEGSREAPIMANETEEPMDHDTTITQQSNTPAADGVSQKLPTIEGIVEQDFAQAKLPVEQRPTRPLDLDLYRAQIPTENIEYIRHLGFQVPQAEPGIPSDDDQGWIYLNLLTNMAQLHTLNVTPSFVQSAITEFSSKFELSSDGRKIKWQTGNQDSEAAGHTTLSRQASAAQSCSGSEPAARKSQPPVTTHEQEYSQKRQAISLRRDSSMQSIQSYIPLFGHRRAVDEDDDDTESLPSVTQEEFTGVSSGIASTLHRSLEGNGRRDDGLLVFYSNARFCADLTGDRSRGHRLHLASKYNLCTSRPLGKNSVAGTSRLGPRLERRNPLGLLHPTMTDLPEMVNSSSETPFDFTPVAPSPKRVSFVDPDDTTTFPVSGLGGIRPADNLCITVISEQTVQTGSAPLIPSRYRTAIAKAHINPARLYPRTAHTRTIKSRREFLPPSSLPPASYAYLDDDDDDDDDSSMASTAGSVTSTDVQLTALLAAPSAHSSQPSFASDASERGEGEDVADNEVDEDDDASLDFLATARAHNPAAVRAKEREYDAQLADRLAEEIPAGSSAATAGGGSGYASPASRDEDDDEEMGEERSIAS